MVYYSVDLYFFMMGEVEQIFICLRVICIHFIFYKHCFLNWRWLCPSGHLDNPETFLVVTSEGCAAGVSWIDARGAAKHLMIYEAALSQWNVIWLKIFNNATFENPPGSISIDHLSQSYMSYLFSWLESSCRLHIIVHKGWYFHPYNPASPWDLLWPIKQELKYVLCGCLKNQPMVSALFPVSAVMEACCWR